MTTLSVIIPVRNAELLVSVCVTSVSRQLGPGDRIIVVDDASSDGTAVAARSAGATVLRMNESVGPYAARNAAAEHEVTADGLVFFDVRCEALPGWLESHRTMLSSRIDVPFSYSNVTIVRTATPAGRAAHLSDIFSIQNYASAKPRVYYPTCNLGVTRRAFMAVGGFSGVRSGGDADLCWRLLDWADVAAPRVDERTLVQWTPRESIRGFLGQFERYGNSSARLHADQQVLQLGRRALLALPRVAAKLARSIRLTPWDPLAAGVLAAAQFRYEYAYVKEGMRLRRQTGQTVTDG